MPAQRGPLARKLGGEDRPQPACDVAKDFQFQAPE